jgi:hypothetical protein
MDRIKTDDERGAMNDGLKAACIQLIVPRSAPIVSSTLSIAVNY